MIQRPKKFPRRWIWFGSLFLLFVLLNFPVPYYLEQPGKAIPLRPLVHVEDSNDVEEGKLMMTTVTMLKANVAIYLYAVVTPHTELLPVERVLLPDETPKEFTHRQFQMMDSSQQNAVIAAFRYAGVPVEVLTEGVRVTGILPGMPAERVLKVGDRLTDVNGRALEKAEDLVHYLTDKRVGDEVQLEGVRAGKPFQVTIPLAPLPSSDEERSLPPRPGVGIHLMTEQRVEPSRKVEFAMEQVGGPSAGLMLTLEMINQLLPQDITGGYNIAGTGTMDRDGNVGQIGGIQYKVMAANRAKAEIFFVPSDGRPSDDNARLAQAKAEEIDTTMQVVPVQSLQEAMEYLQQLPPKTAGVLTYPDVV